MAHVIVIVINIMEQIIFVCNNAGNVRKTQQWGAFVQPLLQWKSHKYYTTCVFVFVALGIQYVMRMRHIAICGLSGSALLLHVIS